MLSLGRSSHKKLLTAASLLINALLVSNHIGCQESALLELIHFPLKSDLSALFLGIHNHWGC